MTLRIETFSNVRGGNALYKALTHPAAAGEGRALVRALADCAPIAIYDPENAIEAFGELYPLDGIDIAGVYVQQAERLGCRVFGLPTEPVTELAHSRCRSVFVAAFDAERLTLQLDCLLPEGMAILSLDSMRLPSDRLTNRGNYLDPLNFSTNFAFFRDAGGLHTRLTTANYWAGYGAESVTCWLTLFGSDGGILAEWQESCGPAGGSVVIDSRDVRERFRLPEFSGQLFLHIVGAAGHDIVKYALDIFSEDGSEFSGGGERSLSATHDANAWPSERYAGLPAPAPGEKVLLWVQNSHPVAIPAGAIGFNRMGEEEVVPLAEAIGPFASRAVDVADLLPGLAWPAQIELRAGKHMVRPRYEIVEDGRHRIAHVNVERGDLTADPNLPHLASLLGKGYLLPAPILPRADWRTLVLPTPMAIGQRALPIAAIVYDAEGNEILRHSLGLLPRGHTTVLDLDDLSGIETLGGGYGHVELLYDFAAGDSADGWLHAIFRYRRRDGGHTAETSFGAHVFNSILTYRDEPQSYGGRPPGLSTRLFLRLGPEGCDTICQLIYPASRSWRPFSATEIILYDGLGQEVARRSLAIPCSGSHLWQYHELFNLEIRAQAGPRAYAMIRDQTCRLFGYHGLVGAGGAFSLDHMFGF